ncbi:MAG: FtsX-like permease family protein [Terracoccus sp.]
MARREVRRHRGRSLLIAIMVGLPVLLLIAGSTLYYSQDLDTAERLPLQVGQSQGYLTAPQPQQLHQLLDPTESYGAPDQSSPQAKPVPGLTPGEEGAALGRLAGGTAHRIISTSGSARVGTRFVSVSILGVNANAPGASALILPRVTLESGRWPAGPNEVLTTPLGAAAGLPTSGTFELRNYTSTSTSLEQTRTVTVVGTGQGFQTWGGQDVTPVDVVTTPPKESGAEDGPWLLQRDTPITWAEIERLNTYGIGVYSRYVALHPDTITLPPGVSLRTETSAGALYAIGAASLGLLLLTSLLAGPAFAVSASRQRRSLALAASNGATKAQLRRSVLAQALVLGALSSLLGAAGGVPLGIGVALLIKRLHPEQFFGPLQVPWPAVALVTTAGIISSVIAALIPSRGLGRLDIVAVMRGQSVSPRLRRRVPATGAVLFAVGTGAVLVAALRATDNSSFFIFVGGVLLLVIGALLMVPLVLALGGRVAGRMPLPARMAAREAGRSRGRATPTVAAIMAGAAVLTTVCIAVQADTARRAAQYQPELSTGQGIFYSGMPGPAEASLAAIRRVEPSIRTLTLNDLGQSSPGPQTRLAALRPGCEPAEIVRADDDALTIDRQIGPAESAPRCATLATAGSMPGSSLIAADLHDLAIFADLDETQRKAMAAGAVATLDPAAAALLPAQPYQRFTSTAEVNQLRPIELHLDDSKLTLFEYRVTDDAAGGPATVTGDTGTDEVTLPVVYLNHQQWQRIIISWSGGPGGILTTDTAARLGLSLTEHASLLRGDAPITPDQQQRITDAVSAVSADATITIERGFERDDTLIIAIVIAVISLIILVATLIATALAQAEAAPLLGTLAAVGATRNTRRAMASAQATYLALLGALLGLIVGIPPGIAISRIITTVYDQNGIKTGDVIIDIPWLQILLPVLLVPLVAAALAWIAVRRAPLVTRRLA